MINIYLGNEKKEMMNPKGMNVSLDMHVFIFVLVFDLGVDVYKAVSPSSFE